MSDKDECKGSMKKAGLLTWRGTENDKEKIVETRPSILCMTHQMNRKKRDYSVD